MHEGFVNFNAGTLGASMVEGRISAGVVVGDGTDVGGGASIMGTLSGGGTEVVSLGERCLLGANAGLGISLGDDCVVEAGLYVTAGSRVTLPDGEVVKARELSGADGLLFRRNSQTGAIEALQRSGSWAGSTPPCTRTTGAVLSAAATCPGPPRQITLAFAAGSGRPSAPAARCRRRWACSRSRPSSESNSRSRRRRARRAGFAQEQCSSRCAPTAT